MTETELGKLQAENESLRKENNILKEKIKLLVKYSNSKMELVKEQKMLDDQQEKEFKELEALGDAGLDFEHVVRDPKATIGVQQDKHVLGSETATTEDALGEQNSLMFWHVSPPTEHNFLKMMDASTIEPITEEDLLGMMFDAPIEPQQAIPPMNQRVAYAPMSPLVIPVPQSAIEPPPAARGPTDPQVRNKIIADLEMMGFDMSDADKHFPLAKDKMEK